jgi:hypothetical protein
MPSYNKLVTWAKRTVWSRVLYMIQEGMLMRTNSEQPVGQAVQVDTQELSLTRLAVLRAVFHFFPVHRA